MNTNSLNHDYIRTDPALCRLVYSEMVGHLEITASLSRFGGLTVLVSAEGRWGIWQGENILAARKWAEEHQPVTGA